LDWVFVNFFSFYLHVSFTGCLIKCLRDIWLLLWWFNQWSLKLVARIKYVGFKFSFTTKTYLLPCHKRKYATITYLLPCHTITSSSWYRVLAIIFMPTSTIGVPYHVRWSSTSPPTPKEFWTSDLPIIRYDRSRHNEKVYY